MIVLDSDDVASTQNVETVPAYHVFVHRPGAPHPTFLKYQGEDEVYARWLHPESIDWLEKEGVNEVRVIDCALFDNNSVPVGRIEITATAGQDPRVLQIVSQPEEGTVGAGITRGNEYLPALGPDGKGKPLAQSKLPGLAATLTALEKAYGPWEGDRRPAGCEPAATSAPVRVKGTVTEVPNEPSETEPRGIAVLRLC